MTALTFTLKTNPTFKLDCGNLTPNRLAGLSLDEIANLKLLLHRNSPKVADYFDINLEEINQKNKSGSNSSQIIFSNATSQLDYIGYKMSSGQIIINGDAGDFLGAKLHGGSIVCRGNAGDRLGDTMRRGLILVEGNAGDYTASRVIAGTIGILGSTGVYAGYAMRRGTVLLARKPTLHATIQDCGTHTLPFLNLLFKSFEGLSAKFSSIANNRVQRFAGDLASNGNGEILVFK